MNVLCGEDGRQCIFSRTKLWGTLLTTKRTTMTWIRTVSLPEADEKLRQAIEGEKLLYPKEYGDPVHPDPSGAFVDCRIAHTDSRGPVSRLQHLRGADVARPSSGAAAARDDRDHGLGDQPVRVLNRSPAEFLRRVTLDKGLVEALKKDYTTAPISAQDRVMLDYVVKLTKDATKVWKDDIDGLRAAGFNDQGILQITLIASWFNYINRVADALGVGRE